MRVADVEYTERGKKAFEDSQFRVMKLALFLTRELPATSLTHETTVHLDNKEAHLDGIMVLSWIRAIMEAAGSPYLRDIVRYEVRDFTTGRVLVLVYPLDNKGSIREES